MLLIAETANAHFELAAYLLDAATMRMERLP